MRLYAAHDCPYSRRVRISLAEHAIAYDYVELGRTEPYPPEIRGRVPGESGVPILYVRDDFILWDASAIGYWIDAATSRSIYPSSREPRAVARAWQGWISHQLYPRVEALIDATRDEIEINLAAIRDALAGIEPLLGPEWLVGFDFSIADVALGPVAAVLPRSAIASLPGRMPAYLDRLLSRPSVRQACELPDRPSRAA